MRLWLDAVLFGAFCRQTQYRAFDTKSQWAKSRSPIGAIRLHDQTRPRTATKRAMTPAIPPAYYSMINSQTINKQINGHNHFQQHHCYRKEEHSCEKYRPKPLVTIQTQTHPIRSYWTKNNVSC